MLRRRVVKFLMRLTSIELVVRFFSEVMENGLAGGDEKLVSIGIVESHVDRMDDMEEVDEYFHSMISTCLAPEDQEKLLLALVDKISGETLDLAKEEVVV